MLWQGEDSDVEEYVHRIRALRWQAMSVRGEQREGGEAPAESAAVSPRENESVGGSESCRGDESSMGAKPSMKTDSSSGPAISGMSLAGPLNVEQHSAARGEARSTNGKKVTAARLLGGRFTELPERGMDELAAACQAAGLQELFLTSMKLAK